MSVVNPDSYAWNLAPFLARLSQLQRQNVDRLALQEASQAAEESCLGPKAQLATVSGRLRLKPARWYKVPDPAALPLLMHDPKVGWRVLTALNGKGEWVAESWDKTQARWQEETVVIEPSHRFARLSLIPPYRTSESPVARIILDEVLAHRRLLVEGVVGGLLIALLSLVTSLYTMQVYDRVIPTAASQTLFVLTLGVLIAIGFELLTRRLRSHLHDRLIEGVDSQLARTVYLRFLSVRLDQLPQSVGSLAGQLRGYETVRTFLVQLSTHFLVDAPFALIFILVMAAIGGPIALVPLVFLLLSIAIGLLHKGRVLALTQRNQAVANFKTGLLVETVEGAEIIKSGQGGWRMLGRWLHISDEARDVELSMRNISERAQHLAAAFQQIAYIFVIALGSILVSGGELSFGGLIACSILSGRVLSPVSQLTVQLVQWGHAKAALQGLDAIWHLEDDHHGIENPVLPDTIVGHYRVENARFSIHETTAIELPELVIRPGEKIAILGPIGAGKTTLLRLLSGMYKPQQGRILLDGVDIAQIAKPWLAERIGYLPQDGRLFSGTLRENLLLGLSDLGDGAIIETARQSGLMESVIATHPLGLEQPIFEGGTGLSGGQRQLVNLTRVLLRKPRIWLLDEPTASLDRNTELHIIDALKTTLGPQDTLVLVTHKPEMLGLVDRILVIANSRIIMDGPRDSVLARLQAPPQEAAV